MTTQYGSGDKIHIVLYKKLSNGTWVNEYNRVVDMTGNTHFQDGNAAIPLGSVFGDRNNPPPYNPEPWGLYHDDPSNYEFSWKMPTPNSSIDQEYAVEVFSEIDGSTYGMVGTSTAACGLYEVFTFTPVPMNQHPASNPGCTNTLACNYDSTANIDDGSCNFPTTIWWECDPNGTGATGCTACYLGTSCGITPACTGTTYNSQSSCDAVCGAS